MEKVLSSDLPPAYCTLSLTPEELAIAAASVDSGPDTEHLISNSFDNKDNRVIFTQKVLAIFLLQTLGVGIILEAFLYYRIEANSNFLWLVSIMLWWISLFTMLYADHIKNRKIYNYAILVCYPITVAFVIFTLPVLVYNMYEDRLQWKLRKVFVSAWMTYVAAGAAVLFYSIFSLDSKHEFKLKHKMLTTSIVFAVLYICMSIPFLLYGDSNHFTASVIVTLFLYLYHLYVLYDINTMTGSDYRCALTPADYVTGAVNLQIDYIFIVKSFICEKCCSDTDNDEQLLNSS